MLPLITLLQQINDLPGAPGITRAIADGAEIWNMFHQDAITVRPDGDGENMWQGPDISARSFLALFPTHGNCREVEFFLSQDLERGLRGVLTTGSIRWENGEYSMLQPPLA